MATPEPEPPQAGSGFQACFSDLVDRRLGTLGSVWNATTSRSRRAEAARRAREEMARRIETRSGRRYAEATIGRWAARDHWPPGVEPFWLQRWAHIDRAGGIAALAAAVRSTKARVRRWRDSTDPAAQLPTVPPTTGKRPGRRRRIGIKVEGFALITDSKKKKTTKVEKTIPWDDKPYAELVIDDDSGIIEAWFDGDIETLKTLLGPVIAEQLLADWNPSLHLYDIEYVVTEILTFLPDLGEEP